MKASIQQKIKPPVAQPGFNFNDRPSYTQPKAVDSTGGIDRTSFKDLLLNSNAEVAEERRAKKAGDYSNLNEDEFLQRLQDDSKPKRAPKNTLDKDDFLKLFVTQLKHQDPLNPDDGAEMAAKLAQFHGLEQAMNSNKNLKTLIDGQNQNQSLQLIGYLGKEIELDGGFAKVTDGKTTLPEVSVPITSNSSTLTVRDSFGKKIFEKELGGMQEGTHQIQWDAVDQKGKPVGDGIYTFELKAKSMNNEDVEIPLSTPAKITGVDINTDENLIKTDFGKVPLTSVKSVGLDRAQAPGPQGQPIPPQGMMGMPSPMNPNAKNAATPTQPPNPTTMNSAPPPREAQPGQPIPPGMIPQDIPMVNQAQKAPPKQSPEANGIRPTKRTLERQMAKERQGATPESSVKEPVMPASSEVQAPQIP